MTSTIKPDLQGGLRNQIPSDQIASRYILQHSFDFFAVPSSIGQTLMSLQEGRF